MKFQIPLRWLALSVATSAVWTSSGAAAQEGPLSACLAIPDIARRVACYDAIARAEQASPDDRATSKSPAAKPLSSASPRADFGLSAAARDQRRPAEQQQLDRLDLTVSAGRVTGPGYWRFTMSDGSIWQLVSVRRAFRPPPRGTAVLITRGALGSYFLNYDNQPAIRIKRLQ